MKRKIIRTMNFFLILLIMISGFLMVGCGPESASTLTIVSMNDTHSHLEKESMTSMYFNNIKTKVNLGGFPAFTKRIKQIKDSKQNVLVLHAGDAVSGTIYYPLFEGEAEAKVMNVSEVDIMTLGNHSFDKGDAGLSNFLDYLDESKVKLVCANIEPQSGNILENKWEPYTIIEKNEEKYGIIGITISEKTQHSSSPSNTIDFLTEKNAVEKYVKILEDQDINKIIVLSHYGYENDKKLAGEVAGVDIIVGGDSHTRLGNLANLGYTSAGDYPTQITSLSGEPVYIVQNGEYTQMLGELHVEFDKDGIVINANGSSNFIVGNTFKREVNGSYEEVTGNERIEINTFINNNPILIVEEDENVANVIKIYADQKDTLAGEKIGEVSGTIIKWRIPDSTNMNYAGSIVAKAFYETTEKMGVNACILNSGSIRADISSGDFTIGNAYELLPFGNTLQIIEMTGDEIKQVLEDASDYAFSNTSNDGAFPCSYHLEYVITRGNTTNNRISDLKIWDKKTSNFVSIESDTKYKIVTYSYLAGGKDGYVTFKTVVDASTDPLATYDTQLNDAQSFINYVKTLTNNSQVLTKPTDTEIGITLN